MEKFTFTLHGYNPEEVNEFLDNIIADVERILESNKEKNNEIKKLKEALKNNSVDPEIMKKANKYDELSSTLNRAIMLANDTGEHIRKLAKEERKLIIEEAKKDADIIINNAIKRSDELEEKASRIQKNTIIFKRNLRNNLENQMKLIDDIEILENN